MPIYEYLCSNCGHELEELQTMSEQPLTKCPSCGKDTLQRLIGGGSGLIFKGSGFYLTDYKKSAPGDKTNSSTAKNKGKQESKKTESKPAAQKESKKD